MIRFILIFALSTSCVYGQAVFEKVTGQSIVTDNAPTPSALWEDYDQDGDLDVYVCNGENNGRNYFYVNNGDGSFTSVENLNILTPGRYTEGACWGDYNNDGYPDLFITHGNYNKADRNSLYINNRNGSFTEITQGPMLVEKAVNSACAWIDYDNDKDLDLYVGRLSDSDGNIGIGTCQIFENDGKGSFSEKWFPGISEFPGTWLGGLWADYNNDGKPDLLCENRDGGAYLYTNLGNSFSAEFEFYWGRSGCWGDYDNDGDLDLFVTKDQNGTTSFKNYGNFLYPDYDSHLNTSKGGYNANGSSFGDLDNDGDLDLIVTYNADDRYTSIFYNDGEGNFTESIQSDVSANSFGYGNNIIDFNNDGFLDLFILNRDNVNFLYKNKGNCNSWTDIKIRRDDNNKFGIGAHVRVKATIGGRSYWQLREVQTVSGAGYMSQNGSNVHFGLGDAKEIDSLIIEWPYGERTIKTHLPINKFLTIYMDGNLKEQQPLHIKTIADNYDLNDSIGCLGSQITLKGIGGKSPFEWFVNIDSKPSYTGENFHLTLTDTTYFTLIDGCGNKTKTKINVVDCDLFVPNLITPNGDNENDKFYINGKGETNIKIYNRWGELIYQNDNYQNNWSGEGQEGIYYYEVSNNIRNQKLNGWIHVLK